MTTVTVIASVHNERGAADARGLLDLLQHLTPSVVFLERGATAFKQFCNESGIESRAICQYRELTGATLLPVDLDSPPPFHRSELDRLYDAIERQSQEYCRLEAVRDEYTATAGFAFLNSRSYLLLCSAIQAAEEAAIAAINVEQVAATYRQWRGANESREAEMMARIVAYASNTPFANGVFVIGGGHFASIYAKANAPSREPPRLTWSFPGVGRI